MPDKTVGMLECQICGHKACEHIAAMAQEHTDQIVKMRRIIETAAKIAGEKLTGRELEEAHVRRVSDMFIREEHMVTWMTMDERKAMELDLGYRDHRIQELEADIKTLETKLMEVTRNAKH